MTAETVTVISDTVTVHADDAGTIRCTKDGALIGVMPIPFDKLTAALNNHIDRWHPNEATA